MIRSPQHSLVSCPAFYLPDSHSLYSKTMLYWWHIVTLVIRNRYGCVWKDQLSISSSFSDTQIWRLALFCSYQCLQCLSLLLFLQTSGFLAIHLGLDLLTLVSSRSQRILKCGILCRIACIWAYVHFKGTHSKGMRLEKAKNCCWRYLGLGKN